MKKLNNSDIERRIETAFKNSTPDVLSQILSKCDEPERKVINMTDYYNKPKKAGRMIAMAAGFAAIVGIGVGAWALSANNVFLDRNVVSTITIDVNPSIELGLNAGDQIVTTKAVNDEGLTILENQNYEGQTIDTALPQIVDTMQTEGYLEGDTNAMLIDVNGQTAEKTETLTTQVEETIDPFEKDNEFWVTMLNDYYEDAGKTQEIATEYTITEGKAQLISMIDNSGVNINTVEDLAKMSITELLYLSDNYTRFSNSSNASSYSLNGVVNEEIAINYAIVMSGIDKNTITDITSERGKYKETLLDVYNITFTANGVTHEYIVEAQSGYILSGERNVNNKMAEIMEDNLVFSDFVGAFNEAFNNQAIYAGDDLEAKIALIMDMPFSDYDREDLEEMSYNELWVVGVFLEHVKDQENFNNLDLVNGNLTEELALEFALQLGGGVETAYDDAHDISVETVMHGGVEAYKVEVTRNYGVEDIEQEYIFSKADGTVLYADIEVDDSEYQEALEEAMEDALEKAQDQLDDKDDIDDLDDLDDADDIDDLDDMDDLDDEDYDDMDDFDDYDDEDDEEDDEDEDDEDDEDDFDD